MGTAARAVAVPSPRSDSSPLASTQYEHCECHHSCARAPRAFPRRQRRAAAHSHPIVVRIGRLEASGASYPGWRQPAGDPDHQAEPPRDHEVSPCR